MLAYNNNILDKMILAHAYQQQFGEKILLYDIDDIWSGKRNRFMSSSSHELEAVKFLTKLDLNPESIQLIIRNYNIDLDVADSRGNTRLMISSANDQHEVIKCLINLGAELECYNDDGFTPLNLTIMRYICLLNNIEHWTEYLIPHVNLKFNVIKEDQHITLNNIQKINFFQPENLKNMKFTENDDDVDEMNSSTIQTATKKQTLLDLAENTILLLINMGAKATTCTVPKISIHLALLTINANILKAVFEAGGSPTYTSSNENYKLNLLHMAVMMPTNYSVVQCIKVLITQCVNPNLKALPMFSIFRYKLPWSKLANKNNASVTPLDIFCLKENIYEFDEELTVDEKSENELASMLYDATNKSHTYCGFEPIVLAMLTGKLHLTKMFLEKNRSVVNKIISGFGTLLSLLLNPFYNFNLSNTKLNKLLDLLLKTNSNPLKIIKIFNMKFRGNICEYYSNLSESEKLNGEKHPSYYSNIIEIKKKLRNSGKEILDIIYSKRATIALINDYRKNMSTPSLSVDEKMAMLLWLNLGNAIFKHRAKIVKMSSNQLFKFKTVQNNKFNIKEKMKNETYILCLQHIKSTTHNPIILTKEESQVCYECLHHQSKEMEACSKCYFALLCSESCKNQHNKENNCKLQLSEDYIIQIQNELNNNITATKSNTSSKNHIFTEKSTMISEQLKSNEYVSLSLLSSHSLKSLSLTTQSRSSDYSKTSDNTSSDDASNYSEQSQKEVNGNNGITHSKQYKKKESKIGSKYSKNNKTYNSLSSEINNRVSIRSSSNGLDDDKKNYIHSDIEVIIDDTKSYTADDDSNQFMESNQSKKSKNKVKNTKKTHSKKYKKSDFEVRSNYSKTNKIDSSVSVQFSSAYLQSTNSKVRILSNSRLDNDKKYFHTDSVVKLQNNNERNNRKSGKNITRNRKRKLILNNKVNIPISSMKYRTVRSPGCWIPIFMFINRGSYEDVTILKNVISSGMSYILMVKKNGQVYNNIIDNQFEILNNYSLI
ncbi:uncharacterized protein LOC114131004 [Aphis gossypii]|uniref:uncharacterized protein LOC114131004 n=1 Tax=Aphis gossypii TaxID=80765 RepID=UPI0021596EAB|nr:uncharacterized protein LOC114131004 [Aphis gossypii]XP_050058870.1 uncharacterized protein LOC114131004 [Aphis gossypii]XP_050058871.1 uncharacterized protein LOC114131004 [Aphis gossypii]